MSYFLGDSGHGVSWGYWPSNFILVLVFIYFVWVLVTIFCRDYWSSNENENV